MEIFVALKAFRIVPVVVLEDADTAGALADALVAGGLPVAEITFRTPAAAQAIETIATRGDILVGAGTVLSSSQVDRAVEAGAAYIVSPGLDRDVVERCRMHGIPALPGVVTATEVQAALSLGLKTVKFFPAGPSGGPAAIAALAAPFSDVSFVPSGGVGPANLHDYLALPAVAAVGGSWMVSRDLIGAGDFGAVTRLTTEAVRAARTTMEPMSSSDRHQSGERP